MTVVPKTFAAVAIAASLFAGTLDARAQTPAAPPLPPPPPPGPPPTAPGPPPSAEPRSQVRFEPSDPGLTVLTFRTEVPVIEYQRHWWYERAYVGGFAAAYSPICNAPCAANLVPGEYHLALSKNGGRAIAVPEPATITGPSTVRAYYTDRSGQRAAGWIIGVAGAIGGVVMIIASSSSQEVCDSSGNCFEHDTVNAPLLVGGIAVLVASGIVGSILVLQHDEAHITVEPLTLPAAGGSKESPLVALGAEAPPQGLALRVRF